MAIGAPASAWESIVSKYAVDRCPVAPLASFYGRVPSAAEAQNLASWAKAYGPGGTFWAKRSDGNLAFQTIEFGNETSYGYQYGDNAGTPSYQARAQTYAVRLKEAAEAIGATGAKVGLLAVSRRPSGNWMNGMFQAVPNLGNYVSGWVTHPYGTVRQDQARRRDLPDGRPRRAVEHPDRHHRVGHLDRQRPCVYENYGLNPCMSYAEAADTAQAAASAEIKSLAGNRLQPVPALPGPRPADRGRDQRPRGLLRAAAARRPAEGRLHDGGAGTARPLARRTASCEARRPRASASGAIPAAPGSGARRSAPRRSSSLLGLPLSRSSSRAGTAIGRAATKRVTA